MVTVPLSNLATIQSNTEMQNEEPYLKLFSNRHRPSPCSMQNKHIPAQ